MAALAPGPTGGTLDTSGANPSGSGAAVDEEAVPSGTLVASTTFPLDAVSGPTQLAAGPENVWSAYRGGMAGGAPNLSRTDLSTAPTTRTRSDANLFFAQGGVSIEVVAGALWLGSAFGLACADPATGSVRSWERVPHGTRATVVAAVPGRIFASRTSKAPALVSIHVPRPCLGPPSTAVPPSTTAAVPGTPPCGGDDAGTGVRPALVFVGCTTRAVHLADLTWSTWSSTSASGRGELSVDRCVPDCATGASSSSQVEVVLSNPGSVAATFVFRTLSYAAPTGTPQTATVPGDRWGWVAAGR